MMQNFQYFFLLLILLSLISCNRQHVVICNPDRIDQCITVQTRAFSDVRYVIDGKHKSIPNSNFVKVNLSQHYRPGDTINICWDSDDYEWIATIDKSVIVENNLDQKRFQFSTSLPKNSLGVPTEEMFRQPGCTSIGLHNGVDVFPEGSAIIH